MLDKITSLIKPLLDSLNLELWGLEYIPASQAVLRVFIEKKHTTDPNSLLANEPTINTALGDDLLADNSKVEHNAADADNTNEDFNLNPYANSDASIANCSEASRLIGLSLEVEDIIPIAYILELSTPGLDRQFFKKEQLAQYSGKLIDLSLQKNVKEHPGRKRFKGIVQNGADSDFVLSLTEQVQNHPTKLNFSWDLIKKVKLIYEPPVKQGEPIKKQKASKKK